MQVFDNIVGFNWDEHNRDKNLVAHGVTNEECEEVFFDPDKKVLADELHSKSEVRFILIGCTSTGRPAASPVRSARMQACWIGGMYG